MKTIVGLLALLPVVANCVGQVVETREQGDGTFI